MRQSERIAILAIIALPFCVTTVDAGGVLDGRIFSGTIGPSENPDLDDSLHFSEGYFWSDICTRCGFVPGPYSSERTEDGVRFSGVLESDSRGLFEYNGLVRDDGTIKVAIRWERRRWYWTSSREIAFQGNETRNAKPSLNDIRTEMQNFDPTENPLCTRF